MSVRDAALHGLPERLQQPVVNLAVEMQHTFSDEALSAAETEEQVMKLTHEARRREMLG